MKKNQQKIKGIANLAMSITLKIGPMTDQKEEKIILKYLIKQMQPQRNWILWSRWDFKEDRPIQRYFSGNILITFEIITSKNGPEYG